MPFIDSLDDDFIFDDMTSDPTFNRFDDYKPLNFLDIYHTYHDKSAMIMMCNELIMSKGFQCVFYKYIGTKLKIGDSLYKDTLTMFDRRPEMYEKINTWIVIDYVRLNAILQSPGLILEPSSTLTAMMMLKDKPDEDDIIELKLPYDNKFLRFRIGGADIHGNIVYHINLNPYIQDNTNIGEISYDIRPESENHVSITSATEKIVIPKERRY